MLPISMRPMGVVRLCVFLTATLLGISSTVLPALAARSHRPSDDCTPGPHSGVITVDQTWCMADNPHILIDEVSVAAGVTLTIEPGVIVQAGIYDGLTIRGRMDAIGTIDQPILFTSLADTGPEQWRGLGFLDSAASGHLRYVTVRYGGMYHSEVSTYAEVAAINLGAGRLTIEDSQIHSAGHSTSGHNYGLTISNSQFTMLRTTVSNLGCCSNNSGVHITGANTVATLSNNTFSGIRSTALIVGGGASATISHNDFHGNTLAMVISGDQVLVEDNAIYDNTAAWVSGDGGIHIYGGSPTIRRNILRNNTSDYYGAISISGAGSPLLENNVIIGNHADYQCSAIYIQSPANPIFKHNTIANNMGGDGSAICMFGEGQHGSFYNTILANSAVGVKTSFESGSLEMNHTLWDNVPIRLEAGAGSLVENFSISGQAKFDLDGYHLTRSSNAIGLGADVGVASDVDGNLRPQPPGSLPDLGADEFPRGQTLSFEIEFYSGDVKMEMTASGGVQIVQEYYLFWNYGSEEEAPPPIAITITDTLPVEMEFVKQETTGARQFDFHRVGQALTWESQQPAEVNQAGYVQFGIAYSNVEPGQTIDNTVHVTAGTTELEQTVSAQIPFFTPKITYPIDGEGCSGQFLNMVVSGYALPGSLVKLYEDDRWKATGVANEEDGLFTITYDSDNAGIEDYTRITVRSCSTSNPYDCSQPSEPVIVTKQTGFWCPRRSSWEGDFKTVHNGEQYNHQRFGFRNNEGKLATENWLFFAGLGLENSTLSLHLCICPGGTDYPTETWVIAGGQRYDPSGGTTHIPSFSIPQANGAIEFHALCAGEEKINHGLILVDPDGYIFDVTQGFDPAEPTLHTLAGVTVTLMVSEPMLGGWVQWPAHLYDHQTNPQVTGADGYYAFYTQPGQFYVQASGKEDYQNWRSPVITVTNQLVHLNVPLTPITVQNIHPVNLTISGPDRPVLYINQGDTVEWLAEMVTNLSIESRQLYTENPVLRLLSAQDPLINILGWDSGMLAPGQAYLRQFTQDGEYLYSDGLGHTARVVVGGVQVFLPQVCR